MNELMINTNELPIFQNKTLNAATKKIAGISLKIKKNIFEVAFILSKIDEAKAYEEDGFKSAAEYAQKTFGFKKSAAYSLLKIGKEYTAPTLESNLPHEPNNDFSTTQIEKVLPLKSRETVVELVESGEITPDMTCKEIEAVVKSKTKKDEQEPEVTGAEEATGTEEVIEATGEIISEYETICSEIRYLFDNTEKGSEERRTYIHGFLELLAEIGN